MVQAKIHVAFALLTEAYRYAQDAGREVWDFAVEIETLRTIGLTPNDIRWLVAKGYVEFGCEKTKACDAHREFEKQEGYFLNERLCGKCACFVLTETGLFFARKLASQPLVGGNRAPFSADGKQERPVFPPRPHWDHKLRELRVDGQLVKQYRSPAPNQQAILDAFEEEGWPPHIYDPLSEKPEHNQIPQRRLNDSVKSLNRNQKTPLIHFSTDGTGEGIRWTWEAHGSFRAKQDD